MPSLHAGNDASKGTNNAPQRICSHGKRPLQEQKGTVRTNALVLIMVGTPDV